MSQFAGLLVASVAFLVYANSLGNGFAWDDLVVIVTNPALRGDVYSLFSGIDIARSDELTPYYRPLTLLTFLVEERLHGLVPFFMHFLNVLLHAANAFLVYRLARVLTRNQSASLIAGLIFAVHPINTEGVDFLSGGRNTLLSAVFSLSAYLVHHRSVRQGNTAGGFVGAALFLAGLSSKESALAILPFIGGSEIDLLRRGDPSQRRRAIVRLIPYAFCIGLYLVLRSNALSGAGVTIEFLPGLGTRLLNNLFIIPRYLLSVFWPPSMSIKYYMPEDLHQLALPLVISWICIIGVFGWLLARWRTPATLFGLVWFSAFWLPVSGIIPIPSAPMADRYLYVPAIGLWIIMAEQFSRLFSAGDRVRRYSLIAAAIVLVTLAALTAARNRDWKNDVTLFSRYVEQNPERAFGHHNLGCAYLDQVGDLGKAEREFEKALALDPFFPRLRTQMGYIRLLRGDYNGAVNHYNEAIILNPLDAEASLNRAIALDRLGRYDEAVADYKRYLVIPGNQPAAARAEAEARVRMLEK